MDEVINFFTDTATLAIFDCSLLSHRLSDDCDWWSGSFEDIEEVKKGDVSLISLGADGVYKVRVTDGELSGEERDYAKMVSVPLGLRVISGKIFIGKGECLPGDGLNCEESDIHEGEGKHILIENGLYQLNIYLIDWFDSPKYWNSDCKTPDNAPPDFVVLLSKREGSFKEPKEEPRLVSDDEEFLFDSSTRVVGPIEGMELDTKVWKNKSGLTLKECGPLDYKPYFDDYTNVQWKDRVTIRVIEVDHDEHKMRCELVSKNKP